MLGSLGYDVLLTVNRLYNKYRAWRGREYYSVSRAIKSRVKSAVNFIGKYEEQLQNLAVKRQCDGIIAGHVNHPGLRQMRNRSRSGSFLLQGGFVTGAGDRLSGGCGTKWPRVTFCLFLV